MWDAYFEQRPAPASESLTKRIQKAQQTRRAWETQIGDLGKVGKATLHQNAR